MKVKSISTRTLEEFESKIIELSNESFIPNLCLCFSDPFMDHEKLIEICNSNNINLVGSSTSGEISNNKSLEGSFSALLFEMNSDVFQIATSEITQSDYQSANKIGQIAKAAFTDPAILLYAGREGINGDAIVQGIKSQTKRFTPIFGGLAGDKFKNIAIKVYTHEGILEKGIVALILDNEKIKVEGKSHSGWEPLGKTHVVTKANGNILEEIDGQPALELFQKYFGDIKYEETIEADSIAQIPGIYPLKVITEDGSEYLRSPLGYDYTKKSLILAGEVNENQRFKFCPSPDYNTYKNTLDFFKEYREKNQTADCVIVNNCYGRKLAFGPLIDKEIEGIYDLWKAPTIGFFALGEIGNHSSNNICNFHNVTCSLATLTAVKK